MATDNIARGLAVSQAVFNGQAASAGVPTVPAYLGPVANRINIPTLVNASLKQINFRRGFRAMDDITSLQVAFPNWFSNNAVNEAGSGGTAVFNAAIERVDGSIQAFSWSGSSDSPSVADGSNSPLTDALTLTTPIKRGEWYAIRGHGEFSAAIVINSVTASTNATLGDGLETAASGQTNKTLTGTIAAQANTSFGPCRVLARTTRRTWAMFGDSRVRSGAGANTTDTCDGTGDLGEVARSIGQWAGYINMGTATETLAAFLTNNSRRLALAQDCTDVVLNYGINDMIGSATAATILANMATALALPTIAARRPKWTTIGPRPTSSDSFVTIANQTVSAFEAVRTVVNDTLRANKVAGLVGCFDICGVTESSLNSGKWAIGNGGQAITTAADGLHLNALGCILVRDSGVISQERAFA